MMSKKGSKASKFEEKATILSQEDVVLWQEAEIGLNDVRITHGLLFKNYGLWQDVVLLQEAKIGLNDVGITHRLLFENYSLSGRVMAFRDPFSYKNDAARPNSVKWCRNDLRLDIETLESILRPSISFDSRNKVSRVVVTRRSYSISRSIQVLSYGANDVEMT